MASSTALVGPRWMEDDNTCATDVVVWLLKAMDFAGARGAGEDDTKQLERVAIRILRRNWDDQTQLEKNRDLLHRVYLERVQLSLGAHLSALMLYEYICAALPMRRFSTVRVATCTTCDVSWVAGDVTDETSILVGASNVKDAREKPGLVAQLNAYFDAVPPRRQAQAIGDCGHPALLRRTVVVGGGLPPFLGVAKATYRQMRQYGRRMYIKYELIRREECEAGQVVGKGRRVEMEAEYRVEGAVQLRLEHFTAYHVLWNGSHVEGGCVFDSQKRKGRPLRLTREQLDERFWTGPCSSDDDLALVVLKKVHERRANEVITLD